MSSKQAPIHSGFGPTTTARETLKGIDLTGKIAIVTGGYAGLGLEATRALAQAGATVIVPARSPDKARQALDGIPRVEQGDLDLLDPVSIDAFASEFLGGGRPLHMLINNAGIMAAPLTRDRRGYESQFSANHLGHFQLTVRLWPALRRAGSARVVSLSSRGHQRAGVDFDDPNFLHRTYDRWQAYGQSKTANVLFAVGLDRRGETSGIRAFAVHPGGILTDLSRHMTDDELRAFEFHILQLPRSTRKLSELTSPLDAWLYFLRFAEKIDTAALPAELRQPSIVRAVEELTMLTQSDIERERYESRRKAQMDQISAINAARLQGERTGQEKGELIGREKGELIGREKGELTGREKGEQIGVIHLCESLLNQPITPKEKLLGVSLEELTRLADELRKQVMKR